jgi:hypothetical protein
MANDKLQKPESALPATQTERAWGETLSSADYNLPKISLVQALSMSASTTKPGHWYNEQSQEDLGTEITVVVLDVVAGHMRFGPDGKLIAVRWKSPKLKGYFPELITEADIENRVYQAGSKAKITDAYCYIAILNQHEPCLITFKSTACTPARSLNSMLAKKTIGEDGKMIFAAPYEMKYKFSARFIDKGTQKYWLPVIAPAGKNEGGYLEAAKALFMDLKGKTIAHGAEEVEEVKEGSEPGDKAPF